MAPSKGQSGYHPSSFRDPSGFLFTKNGIIYRQINKSYQENWEMLEKSGLLKKLTSLGLLVAHQKRDLTLAQTKEVYLIIEPKEVPFISYPYEWSFSQLKDAALATLEIQKIALEHGMCLKDSTAYN